ncbi:MAG: ABC-ATPase domain-containing protein [bacterium]
MTDRTERRRRASAEREARPARELEEALRRLDGRGYKAYRDIEGVWQFPELTLHVDRVQSDPFAAPSRMRLRVPHDVIFLDRALFDDRVRRMACAVWLARAFRSAIRSARPPRIGTGKGGLIAIDAGGQEVLERSAVVFGEDFVEARIEVGLPAAGRRALGSEAARLLVETIPRLVSRAWIERSEAVEAELRRFVDCIENQEHVRARLNERGLVAFVGEGAILPRASGASEQPMASEHVLPFEAPEAFRVEIEVPHADAGAPGRLWRGMGIPRGVTLLVGGGYHGKSTLLRALERGVAPHVPGDGRETVVSDPALVKIRAEDGRAVTGVDIQAFIDRLPIRPGEVVARDTRSFSSEDASGSTSQAANIAEALEVGASGLLLDEDTCATNFMVRDARMQALVHPEDEPITPFLDRVRELYERFGVSSVIVMGGSGDYFEVADAVLEMHAYQPRDATARAREIAAMSRTERRAEPRVPLRAPIPRIPDPSSFDARRGRKEVKLSSRDCEEIVFGTTAIDLRSVEQLFDPSQTRAIAGALYRASERFMSGQGQAQGAGDAPLARILDAIEQLIDERGLDVLDPHHRAERHPGALARPRRFELAAAINRMRGLRVRQVVQTDS